MKKNLFPVIIVFGLLTINSLQAEDPIDFEKQIYPLFKTSCVKCHYQPYEETRGTRTRTRKPKAGITMSTKEGIVNGVDENDEKILKPGDSKNSRLLAVTKLPLNDDFHFPPVGKAPQWTDEDKALVAKWIDQGAKFGEWTKDEKDREGIEWDGKEKTEELQKAVDAEE